jgi:hypothetical protein
LQDGERDEVSDKDKDKHGWHVAYAAELKNFLTAESHQLARTVTGGVYTGPGLLN